MGATDASHGEHAPPGPRVLAADALGVLIQTLRERGFAVIAPVERDRAIDLVEIDEAERLPRGVRDDQEAGRYRLEHTGSPTVFGVLNGGASWKKHLHPPERRVWRVEEDPSGPVVVAEGAPDGPMAFLGVRACDLAAIGVLDRVLAEDGDYRARRDGLFVVAVQCGRAGATCFCESMGTGPAVTDGHDLVLTEIEEDGRHVFLVRAGSAEGRALLAELPTAPATARDESLAADAVETARAQMGRRLDTHGLEERLAAAAESPHWERVAERCLTCANCTMVCPTCYCTGFRDTADLDGSHAERWRHWDSCFTLDFTFAMGGPVRQSGASRYRQWLTHKLSTWVDQFGEFGCIGCGRCIAWCPVGIDITAEAAAVAAEPGSEV